MAVTLKITGECTNPKCGATLQLIQDAPGSTYKATCECGAVYEGSAQIELTPPPGDATAAKTTTTTKAATT